MSDKKVTKTSMERPALSSAVRALLMCGVVSSLLYIGADILASAIYPGYSYASQMISELGAIGAPTRPLWIAASTLYNPLVIAFGIGVWLVAGEKRSLRVSGAMLVCYGIVSAVGPFVPMQQRGSEMALTDVLHITCTAGMLLFMLLFIGFGANASGKSFQVYSIATLAAMVIGGALAGFAGAQMAAGAATPMMGIMERLNVYAEMVWVAVLGVVILRSGVREVSHRPMAIPAMGVPTAALARWR